VWAKKIHATYPSMEDVQERLHALSSISIEAFPATMRDALEDLGKVRNGHVHLMDSPDDVSVIVNGGSGNLHAVMLPGMSNLLPVTRSLDPADWPTRH
jgi:hypothetical protein